MGHRLTDVHPHDVVTIGRVDTVKAGVHLPLGTESLDDTQTAQRFLHLTHRVAPQSLCLDTLLFQLTAYDAHEPAEDRYEDDGEQGELPRHEQECCKVDHDKDGVLEQHIQTRHNARLHLLHIAAHPRDNVTLPFFAEESQWQRGDLLVQLVADVAHHTSTYRDDGGRREEVGSRLQGRGEGQEDAYQQKCRGLAILDDQLTHVVVQIVHQHVFHVSPVPCHQRGSCFCVTSLEQDLQDRYQCCKREDIEHSRQDVEDNRQHQVFLIWRHKPPQYIQKLFHSIFNFQSSIFNFQQSIHRVSSAAYIAV